MTELQAKSDALLDSMRAGFVKVVLPTPAMDCSGVVLPSVWWMPARSQETHV
jgi:hypothetical protein